MKIMKKKKKSYIGETNHFSYVQPKQNMATHDTEILQYQAVPCR